MKNALLALMLCTSSVVAAPIDRAAVIESIEKDLDVLQRNLDNTLAKMRNTQTQLTLAQKESEKATFQVLELKEEIEQQTKELNDTNTKLNKQVKETEVWKEKHAECLKQLWWYRKIAIAIGSAIALYGAFLILKVMGKLPI